MKKATIIIIIIIIIILDKMHNMEHDPQAPQLVHTPGQLTLLQGRVSRSEPKQLAPPLAGAGSLHCRDLVAVPGPQVAEHTLHGNQLFQLPLTETTCSAKK